MLGILALCVLAMLDALILVGCISAINDEEIDFTTAGVIAIAISILMVILSFVLGGLGIIGFILSAVICALVLGVTVSAILGTEIKRAFIIGFAFVALDFFMRFGAAMLLAGG